MSSETIFECNNCGHTILMGDISRLSGHELSIVHNYEGSPCPMCGTTTYEGTMYRRDTIIQEPKDESKLTRTELNEMLSGFLAEADNRNMLLANVRDKENWRRTVIFDMYKTHRNKFNEPICLKMAKLDWNVLELSLFPKG